MFFSDETYRAVLVAAIQEQGGDIGNGEEVRSYGRWPLGAVRQRGHVLGTADTRKRNRHRQGWR